jgi:hypothetical protein
MLLNFFIFFFDFFMTGAIAAPVAVVSARRAAAEVNVASAFVFFTWCSVVVVVEVVVVTVASSNDLFLPAPTEVKVITGALPFLASTPHELPAAAPGELVSTPFAEVVDVCSSAVEEAMGGGAT